MKEPHPRPPDPGNDDAPVPAGAHVNERDTPPNDTHDTRRTIYPTPLENALALIRLGFVPVPIPFKRKKCIRKGWPDFRINATNARGYFRAKRGNVGVLLGEPSCWMVDVDVDHPRAVELADSFLPPTGMTWGRRTKPRSHRIYVVSVPVSSRAWKMPKSHSGEDKMIVELRSTRLQSVAPGSTHESGELVEWCDLGEPSLIDPSRLIDAIEQLVSTVRGDSSFEKTRDPFEEGGDNTDFRMTPIPDSQNTPLPVLHIRPMTPEEVMERTVVTGRGQHNTRSFELARGLKLNAGLSLVQATPFFHQWWSRSNPHCAEKDTFAALCKFEEGYERAIVPLDSPGIAECLAAQFGTLKPVPQERGFDGSITQLIRLIAHIGQYVNGEAFCLSSPTILKAIDVSSSSTTHLYLNGLARRKLIEIVNRGRSGANGTGRSRKIRWLGGPI